jgi:hypothetical protein
MGEEEFRIRIPIAAHLLGGRSPPGRHDDDEDDRDRATDLRKSITNVFLISA